MQAINAARRRFTADEVQRLLASGVLHEDDPIELLDGELFEMSPQGDVHRRSVSSLNRRLVRAVGNDAHVQVQCPIHCDPHNQPEPDFAIVEGLPDAIVGRHPRGDETRLVIELAATSQERDRAKAPVYARAGVPVYWLVDLVAHRVEVHEGPDASGRYRVVRIVDGDQQLAVPGTDLVLTAAELSA